ncbi:helix-turn-helix domain-containing protein [Streptomyces sp. NPDC048389]|uniref:helix-turn-helix domain-containing protein n=1 Tax=Streptomyces sp. NPDC048389 TaxID=3154622 RepID=UPI003454B2AC
MTSAQSIAPLSRGVVHVRHRHKDNFTVVGNHLAQHKTLSAAARGVALYIQSVKDGAKVSIEALADEFPDSPDRLAKALRELEAAGYLRRLKHRAPGQRIGTRTTYYECPGAAPEPRAPLRRVSLVKRAPANRKPHLPSLSELLHQPAAQLLAGLRTLDPRLTLSVRDIAALAPAVTTWLDRDVPGPQVARTLSSLLPPGTLHRPSRLLAYRLENWLPPELPKATTPIGVVPLVECEDCGRPFRSAVPGHCRDCRPRHPSETGSGHRPDRDR